MTKYLISFPSEAMVIADGDLPIVAAEAHAVIDEAKAAGVYVFGGGIEEEVEPVLVAADGSVSAETYPGSRLKGGFTRWKLRRAKRRSNGRARSRCRAAVRRNCASSCTIRRADGLPKSCR